MCVPAITETLADDLDMEEGQEGWGAVEGTHSATRRTSKRKTPTFSGKPPYARQRLHYPVYGYSAGVMVALDKGGIRMTRSCA